MKTAVEKVCWRMVKSQGKVIEKSGDFEIENEWQPMSGKLIQPHLAERG